MAVGQANAIETTAVFSDASTPVAVVDNRAGSAPILLICEHASNHLPERYGTLGLSPEERDSHIAWDPGALEVARGLSRRLDAPLVSATVSRLVIDLNREPTAPDSITRLSEHTAVPGNADLSADERERRVREVYEPFHDSAARFLHERSKPTSAVVSIHSFTPVYRGVARPWQIGLIFDQDRRLADAVADALTVDASLKVGLNEPYSPADRVFHTLDRHAVGRGLAPLMIEIRNDIIRTEAGVEAWCGRLAPILKEALRHL